MGARQDLWAGTYIGQCQRADFYIRQVCKILIFHYFLFLKKKSKIHIYVQELHISYIFIQQCSYGTWLLKTVRVSNHPKEAQAVMAQIWKYSYKRRNVLLMMWLEKNKRAVVLLHLFSGLLAIRWLHSTK